jgi:hypothetical protein
MLGIHSQVLFTSSKESIPLDSNIINIALVNHVLLYFPELKMALSPGTSGTRFPYFPPAWAGMPALRCRDTIIDQKAEAIVDLFRTPVADYTTNNISLEANIILTLEGGQEVKLKQSAGGYPGNSIKDLINATSSAERNNLYNALLPTGPIRVTGLTHKVSNESWDVSVNQTPVVIESSFHTDAMSTGVLINGLVQQYTQMPPPGVPLQIAYPFYQEARLNYTIPDGYTFRNTEDYTVDITSPAVGYKVTCKQTGNTVAIFAVKWFKKTDLEGEDAAAFKEILKVDSILKKKGLILSKNNIGEATKNLFQ